MAHLMSFCQFHSQGRTELSKLKNGNNSFSLFCTCVFGGVPTACRVRHAERLLMFSNSCGCVALVRIK